MKIKTVTKNYNLSGTFVSYQVSYENTNIERSVPLDPINTDYQEIQEWIEDGGTVIDNGGGE